MPVPSISVCILAGHGLEALDACLASLRAQNSPPPFELLVGGNPAPEVLAVVDAHFPDAQFCRTGQLLPGAARNPLVERARGELLLFLDDDVTAPPDLLRNLERTAARCRDVNVFGGPNDTPLNSSRFQAVQGAVLSSLAGSGPVARRYGARHAAFADERWFTLCNLAVRREAMTLFLHDLVCAEENALLTELRRRGDLMRYDPSLRVFHARRASAKPFAQQMFKYGRGRGELMRRDPRTIRAPYLAPAVLLVYLLFAALMVGVIGHGAVVLAPGGAYLALTVAAASRVAWTLRDARDAPLALALIVLLHVCYGGGVLRGMWLPGRGRNSAVTRTVYAQEVKSAERTARRRARMESQYGDLISGSFLEAPEGSSAPTNPSVSVDHDPKVLPLPRQRSA